MMPSSSNTYLVAPEDSLACLDSMRGDRGAAGEPGANIVDDGRGLGRVDMAAGTVSLLKKLATSCNRGI